MDLLEMKLEVAVSCPTCSLGSELRTAGGVGRIPNCAAILLTPQILFFLNFILCFVCFPVLRQGLIMHPDIGHKITNFLPHLPSTMTVDMNVSG